MGIKIVREEEDGEMISCPCVFCDICGNRIKEDLPQDGSGIDTGGEYMWFLTDDNPMRWKAMEVHFVHHRCVFKKGNLSNRDERLLYALWGMMKDFHKYLGVNLRLIKGRNEV